MCSCIAQLRGFQSGLLSVSGALICWLDSRMAGQTFPKKRQTQGASFGACSDPVREAETFSGGATRPLTVNFCTRRGRTRRTVSAWHHAKPLSVALDLQQQVCVLSHRPRPTGGEVSVTRGRAHMKKKKSPSVTLHAVKSAPAYHHYHPPHPSQLRSVHRVNGVGIFAPPIPFHHQPSTTYLSLIARSMWSVCVCSISSDRC